MKFHVVKSDSLYDIVHHIDMANKLRNIRKHVPDVIVVHLSHALCISEGF